MQQPDGVPEVVVAEQLDGLRQQRERVSRPAGVEQDDAEVPLRLPVVRQQRRGSLEGLDRQRLALNLNFLERTNVEEAGGFEPPNKDCAVQSGRVTNSYQILPTQNGEKVEDPIQ